MKINQAAELAGITSKNIRFYEDQGLITPARDSINGYRDYSMEDVEQLCRIRLLRMLGISCENIGRDFMAGMKTLVGGEIKGYTEMLIEARQLATKRMVDEAEELGADAVVGLRYGSSQVMDGAAEVLAYGTAVKIIEKK
ncbi:MAG: heavy metal-binding domain-containing protein [Mogibacterium sp.]|nr:heavy metal-binding domain-containing protein [Mogibacterium sp.]